MSQQTHICVGMGGWDLFPFDKVFYPPLPKRGFRKLEYYSQFFDFVEINATFYNASFTPAQVQRWLSDVSSNKKFIFAVKLFKGFTHSLDATKIDVVNVHRLLDILASQEKFGGLLAQFPYSFTNTHERQLYVVRLCKAFAAHPVFVEFRHNSWNSPLVEKLFTDQGTLLVNVDLPQIKRHMPLTEHCRDEISYFRMMGRNVQSWDHPWRLERDGSHLVSDRYHYLYAQSELELLAQKILRLKPIPATTFVVFHNDPQAQSLVNGFQLRRILNPKERILIPENLVRAFPVLQEIGTATETGHSLFDIAKNNP